MILTGEIQRTRRKNCPSYTTNPSWTDLAANPQFCCENLSTNHLSYGTASYGITVATVENPLPSRGSIIGLGVVQCLFLLRLRVKGFVILKGQMLLFILAFKIVWGAFLGVRVTTCITYILTCIVSLYIASASLSGTYNSPGQPSDTFACDYIVWRDLNQLIRRHTRVF
jgi:hypothetical protein